MKIRATHRAIAERRDFLRAAASAAGVALAGCAATGPALEAALGMADFAKFTAP